MQLTVIGCSPAWPNPDGAHSGYLVENGGRSLLLDCGSGVLGRLRVRAEGGLPSVDAIVITHFHLDHFGDLIPWVLGVLGLTPHGRPITKTDLWLPPGGRAQLEELERFGIPGMFELVFAMFEYAPGESFTAGGCSVAATWVPHYRTEAYALRIAGGDRILAYSGDSGPTEELASVARGADLFLCEATLADGSADGEPRGHLSLDEAVGVFRASGARRLIVTHRPVELDTPEDVDVAHDGLVVDV